MKTKAQDQTKLIFLDYFELDRFLVHPLMPREKSQYIKDLAAYLCLQPRPELN